MIMTAQQRRCHNIKHKKLLNDYRTKINENRKDIRYAIEKYHKADKALYKFKDAKRHGLIKVPKEQKLRYKLMIKNGKTEYITLLKNQKVLEYKFHLIAYGKAKE